MKPVTHKLLWAKSFSNLGAEPPPGLHHCRGEQLRQLKVGTSTLHFALDTQPIH